MITLNQRDPRANGGSSPKRGDANNLVLRVKSAAALVPIAIVCAYFGGWLFLCVCALAAGIILWEWSLLVVRSADGRILGPGIAALLAAIGLVGVDMPGAAAGMVTIGAALVGGLVAIWPRPYPTPNPPFWAAGGVIYAGLALLGPTVLRHDARFGFPALLFLAATVWMTDIFAFFVGRAIGGPRLWPQVSPNKTWAGAVGGLLGGVAGGTLVAYASGISDLVMVGVIALVLSVVAQVGDLFESAVKRRFGAKDASHLIPGHGGLMDRVDSFVVAALVALVIGILRHGTDSAAQGLLVW